MTETFRSGVTPHLVIEMRGPNLVVRTGTQVDDAHISALADMINAAAISNIAVIIDPVPGRCDGAFAANEEPVRSTRCVDHPDCEPVDAFALNSRMIRIPTVQNSWTIDLEYRRFCQTAPRAEIRHHRPEGWTPMIAVMVTATRLTAVTLDGTRISTDRAHRSASATVGTNTYPNTAQTGQR